MSEGIWCAMCGTQLDPVIARDHIRRCLHPSNAQAKHWCPRCGDVMFARFADTHDRICRLTAPWMAGQAEVLVAEIEHYLAEHADGDAA